MRIGEVAERSGLSTATIRFYERRGLLPGPGRAANGYREYTPTDLDRTATFARFRDLGLDAPEAARMADQCATGHCDLTVTEMPAVLAGHRAAIAERMAQLQRLDARLAAIQTAVDTSGQSDHLSQLSEKEIEMLECTCDPGCPCPPIPAGG